MRTSKHAESEQGALGGSIPPNQGSPVLFHNQSV
jgi:hypothetical protein